MHQFVFDVVVPAPMRAYCNVAFTAEFDAFILREFGLGALEEHAPSSARGRALDADVSATFVADAWRDWRAQVAATQSVAGALRPDFSRTQPPVAPYLRVHDAETVATTTTRKFRLRPASRIVSFLKSALYWLGYGEDVVHYDAVQVRQSDAAGEEGARSPPTVRFFLRSESVGGFAVEGVTTFHAVEGADDKTLQRVHIAVVTGSRILDLAVSPFIEGALRPEFARMAEAVERWRQAGNPL